MDILRNKFFYLTILLILIIPGTKYIVPNTSISDDYSQSLEYMALSNHKDRVALLMDNRIVIVDETLNQIYNKQDTRDNPIVKGYYDWSDDDQYFLYLINQDIVIVELSTGDNYVVNMDEIWSTRSIGDVIFSEDNTLLTVNENGSLIEYDFIQQTILATTPLINGSSDYYISPTGNYLVIEDQLYNLKQQQFVEEFYYHIDIPIFSPNGSLVLDGISNKETQIYDILQNEIIAKIKIDNGQLIPVTGDYNHYQWISNTEILYATQETGNQNAPIIFYIYDIEAQSNRKSFVLKNGAAIDQRLFGYFTWSSSGDIQVVTDEMVIISYTSAMQLVIQISYLLFMLLPFISALMWVSIGIKKSEVEQLIQSEDVDIEKKSFRLGISLLILYFVAQIPLMIRLFSEEFLTLSWQLYSSLFGFTDIVAIMLIALSISRISKRKPHLQIGLFIIFGVWTGFTVIRRLNYGFIIGNVFSIDSLDHFPIEIGLNVVLLSFLIIIILQIMKENLIETYTEDYYSEASNLIVVFSGIIAISLITLLLSYSGIFQFSILNILINFLVLPLIISFYFIRRRNIMIYVD